MGCSDARKAARTPSGLILIFLGLQIVACLSPQETGKSGTSGVHGDAVPVRHFGVVLPIPKWEAMRDRLVKTGTKFIIEPQVRFAGTVGEQSILIFWISVATR